MKKVISSSLSAVAFLLLGLAFLSPATAQDYPATKQGENAIYESATMSTNSLAFVDASTFYPANADICSIVNNILTKSSEFNCGGNNPKGVTIDARGITPPGGSVLQCNVNPFAGAGLCSSGVDGDMLSSTILLPAATIRISSKWLLPANTRLVGQGQGLTIIQAHTSFSDSNMIEMGNGRCSGADCQGNGIEHLSLDGNGQNVNGISNVVSQELSFVNDVSLSGINGTGIGLSISGSNAVNSGPYSNINFSGSGTCVKINGTYGTRGVHGLTCTATAASSAAVLLDGSNNSIEDVYITGPYADGILVGANAVAKGNVLFNISGGTSVTNVVHISNASSVPPAPNVSDLSVLGVTTNGTQGTVFSIADSLTNTFIQDASVGMYLLGEPVVAGTSTLGYSRFSSNPSGPTWLVGTTAPSGSCSTGSIYSNTAGLAIATLWTCVNGSWKRIG